MSLTREELLQHCIRVVSDQLDVGIERSARGVYYDLVGEGLVEQDRPDENGKATKKNYRRVVETIAAAKLKGEFPLEWLRDDLRPVRHGNITAASMDVDQALLEVESYLRWLPGMLIKADRWYQQPIVPIVIVEKDTLVGTIRRPCDEAQVPWYVCRGYSSLTGLFALAEYLHRVQNEARWPMRMKVLYLGDHDPEGMNIPVVVEKRIAELYAIKGWSNPPGSWERIALTYEQAKELGAPSMALHMKSSRAKGYIEKYGHEAWEIEAMPSVMVQRLLREALDAVFQLSVRTKVTASFPALQEELKGKIAADGGDLAARAYAEDDDGEDDTDDEWDAEDDEEEE